MTTTTRLEIGPLEPFHAAGVLGIPDVQVATALMRIDGHSLDEPHSAGVALAAALCVRALWPLWVLDVAYPGALIHSKRSRCCWSEKRMN